METFTRKYLYYILLLICVTLQAATFVISKYLGSSADRLTYFSSICLLSSMLFLMALQAITWQIVLKKIDLSIAYPSTSMIYLFIFTAGIFFFGEQWNYIHISGLLMILVGTVFLCKEKAA